MTPPWNTRRCWVSADAIVYYSPRHPVKTPRNSLITNNKLWRDCVLLTASRLKNRQLSYTNLTISWNMCCFYATDHLFSSKVVIFLDSSSDTSIMSTEAAQMILNNSTATNHRGLPDPIQLGRHLSSAAGAECRGRSKQTADRSTSAVLVLTSP